ncbi:MAG: extensin family protein [Alphaproteobacteria bacterium]
MRIGAAIFGVTAILIVTAGALLWSGALRVPDRFNPWAPIDIADAPNLLTKYKLKRLAENRAQCLATLETTPLRFTPQADRNLDLECSFRNVVRVNGSSVPYSSSFVATCPLAMAIALFERHALQPAAEAAFGQPVAGVTHLGTYACRNVYGRESGRRSQHATANAIDLSAFRLKDGKTINLRRDWADAGSGGDDAEAGFLRDLRDRACRIFPTVLGPDYNAAHADHFHLDMGGFSICR